MGRAQLVSIVRSSLSTTAIYGDKSWKVWLYRNDAAPGFIIESGTSDVVIAIKGGSNAYNIAGGVVGGTRGMDAHNSGPLDLGIDIAAGAGQLVALNTHKHSGTTVASHRVEAAVGTMQRPSF